MAAHRGRRDEFLSEEDLDLQDLSWEELLAWWDAMLLAAQATNDLDRDEYSHGVFAAPRPSAHRFEAGGDSPVSEHLDGLPGKRRHA